MSKVIAIAGATGQQGGATIRALAGQGFTLRALTLDGFFGQPVSGEFDTGLVGDGQQVQHSIGAATERRGDSDGVLERLLGHDHALGAKIGQFVPAHPIAGREQNGPEAALGDLYVGKKVILTPLIENAPEAIARVANAWTQCGALIHRLDAAEHDAVFAAVSHLPHLLAYALVDDIAARPNAETLFQYAASGFRDFTRIAGSSPEMWRDIALANRSALLSELDSYIKQVAQLRECLSQKDSAGLETIFTRARDARQGWCGYEHPPR
mgnify:CR=1 FL=1